MVGNPIQAEKLNKELKPYRIQQVLGRFFVDAIVTQSPAMQSVLEKLYLMAGKSLVVLITGDRGTGKEEISKIIHANSGRSGPLISVNCGEFSEQLIASELFGHKKGSFTGATEDKKGLIEAADGGILFLDEIGNMPISLQPKLLRVLDTNKVRPIGSNKEIEVDVQLLSATNKNICKLVDQNLFMPDLYDRLNRFTVELPPLSERTEDIPLMFVKFITSYACQHKIPLPLGITKAAMAELQKHPWPGNVRQLKTICEQLSVFKSEQLIGLADLFEGSTLGKPGSTCTRSWSDKKDEIVAKALENNGGKVMPTARELGIPRSTLYRLLDELYKKGITPDDFSGTSVLKIGQQNPPREDRSDSSFVGGKIREVKFNELFRTLSEYGGNRKRVSKKLGVGNSTVYSWIHRALMSGDTRFLKFLSERDKIIRIPPKIAADQLYDALAKNEGNKVASARTLDVYIAAVSDAIIYYLVKGDQRFQKYLGNLKICFGYGQETGESAPAPSYLSSSPIGGNSQVDITTPLQ